MRLNKLELLNFKGVKQFTFAPKGADVAVYGANASGKSTLGDAIFWLLFDKNQDFKSITVKPVGVSGVESCVEGEFILSTGAKITLKKSLSEDWVKKRGALDKVFSGHTTKYWVDEVPVKKGVYTKSIEAITPNPEVFKLLSSPAYFASVLTWQARRELLLSICGDIDDAVVIKEKEALTPLTAYLEKHSINDLKKVIAEKLRDLNKSLRDIPARIDELTKYAGTLDLGEMNATKTREHRRDLNKRLVGLIATPVSAGGTALLEEELAVERVLSQRVFHEQEAAVWMKGEELSRLEDSERVMICQKEKAVEAAEELKALRAEHAELKASEFVAGDWGKETCDYCGQVIPEKKHKEAFILQKNTSLEKVVAEGKKLKILYKDLMLDAEGLPALKKAIAEAKTVILGMTPVELKQTEREVAITKELSSSKVVHISDAVAGQIAELKATIEVLTERLGGYKVLADTRKRVKELKAEEKRIATLYEETDAIRFLLEDFIRTKVGMIESDIMAKLDYPGLNVKLFIDQVNGGVAEVCEITLDGVPFNTALNDGAKVAVGIHLIGVLSKHFGCELPMVIDNCESTSEIPRTASQQIRLFVSAEDKKLRVNFLDGGSNE